MKAKHLALGVVFVTTVAVVSLPGFASETAAEATASASTDGEREAILEAYRRSLDADLEVVRSSYSEDARWLNAFGRVFVGRDAILAWLEHLRAVPGYAASYVPTQHEPEVKLIRPDVAIVHEYHEREGQIIDDVVTPTRRINTTFVLTKESGTWLIRDKVTMDERQRSTMTDAPPHQVAAPPQGGSGS